MPTEKEPVAPEVPLNLKQCVAEFVIMRSPEELGAIAGLDPQAPIPQELDRELLRICGSRLNRWLEETEKHYIRQESREQAMIAHGKS